jgi:hypothetical protein
MSFGCFLADGAAVTQAQGQHGLHGCRPERCGVALKKQGIKGQRVSCGGFASLRGFAAPRDMKRKAYLFTDPSSTVRRPSGLTGGLPPPPGT